MSTKHQNVMELMHKKEPLHPELEACIEKNDAFVSIKHPLVFSVLHVPELNAMMNRSLAHKQEALEKAVADRNWSRAIFLHEKPYRVHAFQQIARMLSDKEYFELLGDVWTDIENHWQWKDEMKVLVRARPAEARRHMTRTADRKFMESLPDEIVVYRGHQKKNAQGLSWTLCQHKAWWFARRLGQTPVVTQGIVSKADVWAVFLGRGEWEIACHPRAVRHKEKKTLHAPVDEFHKLRLLAAKQRETCMGKKAGNLHGPEHWWRVEQNAVRLAKMEGADELVCRLFGIFHDCCRVNDIDDPDHGKRAASYVAGLPKKLLPLDVCQRLALMEAMACHNDGKVSRETTIGCCWDADRMDLTRVGIRPNIEFLSTESARRNLWGIRP